MSSEERENKWQKKNVSVARGERKKQEVRVKVSMDTRRKQKFDSFFFLNVSTNIVLD